MLHSRLVGGACSGPFARPGPELTCLQPENLGDPGDQDDQIRSPGRPDIRREQLWATPVSRRITAPALA